MIKKRRLDAILFPPHQISAFWFFTLFFFLIIFGYCQIAQGQIAPSPANIFTIAEIEKREKNDGEAIWLAHRDFWRKGDFIRSLEELEKLYQWKLNQGIRNHYSYGQAIIRESQDLAGLGKFSLSLSFLNYAEKMAPDLSLVARAKSQVLWREKNPLGKNFLKALQVWLQSIYLSFKNLEEALPQLINLISLIFLSFLAIFIIFSFVLLFRYYPFCAHHWHHLFGAESNLKIWGIIPLLILLIPLALGWGWLGLFIFWFIVLTIYTSRTDRRVMVILLLLLLLCPTGLRLYSSFLISLGSNGNLEVIRANSGVYEANLYKKILALAKSNPQDAELWHTRALLEKKQGRYEEAEKNFLKFGQSEPNSLSFLNNLANIYLITHRLDKAVEFYQKAIKLNPSRAEIHYNLGQAYLLNLQLAEAEAQFQQARKLDPYLISYYTSISTKNPNRLVIDLPLEWPRLWKRLINKTPEREEVAESIWKILLGPIPLKYGEVVLGLTLFLFILISKFWGGSVSIKRCSKCGRRICGQCLRSLVIGQQCAQCLHTFSSYSEVDPQTRQLKKLEVAEYQRRRYFWTKFLSRLFPGAGHLYLGYSGEGIIYLFISFLIIWKIIFWKGWFPSTLPIEISPDWPLIIIMGIFATAFYLIGQPRLPETSFVRKESWP